MLLLCYFLLHQKKVSFEPQHTTSGLLVRHVVSPPLEALLCFTRRAPLLVKDYYNTYPPPGGRCGYPVS